MSIPKEFEDFYALSGRPYVESPGPIPVGVLNTRSWRYLIEVNSECNLRCAMCISGNRKGFEATRGTMPMPLLEKVLDKIRSENPAAIVCPYGSGEPFLHPEFYQVIAAIKRHGFRCEVATNLHFTDGIDKALASGPDFVIVSTSGFHQEVYQKAHRNGNIEKVKENLKTLAQVRDALGFKGAISVSYHMYRDNLGDEMQAMKDYAESLGFSFMVSWARTISMENTVQALRELERQRTGTVRSYEVQPGKLDINTAFPPANPTFIKNMKRLQFHPAKAQALYERFPVSPLCLIGDIFTYIRHDGRVQLCAWTDDARLTLGNYLEMTQDEISAARRNLPFCQECIRYRMNLYFHVCDCVRWDEQTPHTAT